MIIKNKNLKVGGSILLLFRKNGSSLAEFVTPVETMVLSITRGRICVSDGDSDNGISIIYSLNKEDNVFEYVIYNNGKYQRKECKVFVDDSDEWKQLNASELFINTENYDLV